MHKDMEAFFDGLAAKWNNAPSAYETREKLTSLMGLSPGSIIADIGCGKGVMFEHLLKSNPAKIIAVDISGEMIKLAKELYSDIRLEYVHGDFLDIPLPMLDAAVFFNSYPHFLAKEVLAEKLSRILKKGGAVIIAHSLSKEEINGTHKSEGIAKLSAPLEKAVVEAGKFQKYFTADTLIDNDAMYFIRMTRK